MQSFAQLPFQCVSWHQLFYSIAHLLTRQGCFKNKTRLSQGDKPELLTSKNVLPFLSLHFLLPLQFTRVGSPHCFFHGQPEHQAVELSIWLR